MKKSVYAMAHDHVYLSVVPAACAVIGIDGGTHVYEILTAGMNCRKWMGDRKSHLLRPGECFTLYVIREADGKQRMQRERITNINGEVRVEVLSSPTMRTNGMSQPPFVFAAY